MRKYILLFAGISAILLFFCLPANKVWLKNRIFDYWTDFLVQRKQPALERRKILRFNTQYTYSRYIADFFDKKGIKKNVLVLIPPTAYFQKNGIAYPVPYPGVFYYYTDLKTVRANSSNALQANWCVRAENKKIIIDSVTGINQLKDTIAAFKKFQGLYD